ncbi:MAG: cysteine--tRNA ligase [Halothiobacillaceae bacterium]|nr:MAG: cysteine--tRNA ligase [Halothiobacillaceae bacterium]
MLYIYNTETREKKPFTPIEPGKVRMYVCGMTVYDYCHLGHARVMVVFDVVYRYLKHLGFDVTYVRNITDIDDKIIKRAAENGETIQALTQRFIDAMHEDADALGCLRPDHEPRATGAIPEMLAMIATLIEKGFAYVASNGDVYYDVSKFEGYGRLSGKNPEDLRAGSRVEIGEAKMDPLDFVLWKSAKPGEPSWASPWGPGRPGWHIECSAMSTTCLGHSFDIHGGGMDLQFPHHENEIAQSEAATGCHYVNYWMHNGFVRINEEKMSKSLNNFFTVREVMKDFRPEEIRFFILNSHYRSPLNYGDVQLQSARAALMRLYTALRDAGEVDAGDVMPDYVARFDAAMNDDFNTPEAMAVLFDLAGEVHKRSGEGRALAARTLKSLGGIIGLLQAAPEAWLRGEESEGGLSDGEIEAKIRLRLEARSARDFSLSDAIRDELAGQGIVLEDGPGGTRWRREA